MSDEVLPKIARAAIAAIRDPTKAMIVAGLFLTMIGGGMIAALAFISLIDWLK